jgi:CPA2 family monovalent cation:H+ antiporter-2
LAEHLSARAVTLPAQGHADLGATARRALSLTLHSLILVVAGAPLLAITQPFVPMIPWLLGSAVWAMSMGVIALSFWRNASSLLGHVRAGAQAVIALLAKQSHATEHEPVVPTAQPELAPLWSGLGTWITHRVTATDYGAGKTLAELNLRGLTGATVLAIQREDGGSASPSAHQALCTGDVLALLGNAEAVASAVRLLRGDTTADAIASYEFFAVIGD